VAYSDLNRSQRLQIWRNFIERLRVSDSDLLDPQSLMDNIEELADFKFNGRQIRNLLSTSRQLSKFRKQPLSFKTISDVIQETKRFNDYMKLNGTSESTDPSFPISSKQSLGNEFTFLSNGGSATGSNDGTTLKVKDTIIPMSNTNQQDSASSIICLQSSTHSKSTLQEAHLDTERS
jgi:hypothetical protein